MGLVLVHFQKYWLLFGKALKITRKWTYSFQKAPWCNGVSFRGWLHQSGDRKVISRILTGADGDHWVSEKNFFFQFSLIICHSLKVSLHLCQCCYKLTAKTNSFVYFCCALKVRKSRKQFFLKLHFPKRNWKVMKNFCSSIQNGFKKY